jgi:hypothetical protein
MKSICCPYLGKGTLRALLKDHLLKEKGNCSKQIPAADNDRVVNRTLSFTRTPVLTGAGKQSEVSQTQAGL